WYRSCKRIQRYSRKYDISTTKHKTKLKDLLQIRTNILSYFQDLGEYFVIRKKNLYMILMFVKL
ncbi:MAG TPA: hypothetical protein VFP25_06985, partial [Nitrososphaeraceae archaeon]|nr:hypothetical protein [Nitrososphaeraceae archaeon]